MSFEIKSKDARGRIGVLSTPSGKVETPALMPVIHPGRQTMDVSRLGAKIVITNAYLIYKDESLHSEALKKGVHRLINFSGPVVTDSGSYQLSVYGDLKVSNREIIEFQELIGTDIGTSLDIPTPPFASKDKAQEDMKITIKRAREALEVRNKLMLNSVVQGSTYPDLRSRCAQILGGMDFEVHPIGAVVPLLESYRYDSLVEVIMASVAGLPNSRPRHLMGAGHPLVFALAVALGCDLFDSAAYILYAEDDRLLMPHGTYKLDDLRQMPCSCRVCTEYTPEDLHKMDKEDRVKLLAEHNLHISFAEIRLIKQSIMEGNLWELVDQRCRSHPYLLEALRRLRKYQRALEKYDPVFKKSAFFYNGSESLYRPEVYRHQERLKRLSLANVILLPPVDKPYTQHLDEISPYFYPLSGPGKPDESEWIRMVVDVPFGLIPLEVEEVYPLSQNEAPHIWDGDSMMMIEDQIKRLGSKAEQLLIHEDLVNKLSVDLNLGSRMRIDVNIPMDDVQKLKYIADYQYGEGCGDAMFVSSDQVVRSRKTGKIRHVYNDDRLIVTLRARDGGLVWGAEGARRLHKNLPYPQRRVVVDSEAAPFVREGKSIFAKFVINCDINIRATEEVLVVDEKDQLLAMGQAQLNSQEIMDLKQGMAVKNRKGGL